MYCVSMYLYIYIYMRTTKKLEKVQSIPVLVSMSLAYPLITITDKDIMDVIGK